MLNSMWSSWGVSVIGPLHIKQGIPNQDSWMFRKYKWGNVVVVSDGLGSKPHSDHGSKSACLAVFEAVKVYQKNRQAKIEDILRLIHANWLVKVAPFSASDCSATCLFAIQLDNQLILGRLGDGLITVIGETPEDFTILNDDKQDSFSNFTNCLSQEHIPEQWEIVLINSDICNAVILCTDGISEDLLPECQIEFCSEIHQNYKNMSFQQRTTDIYKWLNEWPVPGHTDDKTIACLFKQEESR